MKLLRGRREEPGNEATSYVCTYVQPSRAPPPFDCKLEIMVGRNTFTLDEVMNELDGMEDDSEDDFDGYLDLDTDEREERGEKSANLDVRAHNKRGEVRIWMWGQISR